MPNEPGKTAAPTIQIAIRAPIALDKAIQRYHEQLNAETVHDHGTAVSRTAAIISLITAGLRARGIVSDDETEQEATATEAAAAV